MILIDGTNLLVRLEESIDSKGNIYLAFLQAIGKYCKILDDYKVYVALDITPSKYRTDLYPTYKNHHMYSVNQWGLKRKHNVLRNLNDKILPSCGITSIMVDKVEADDIIYMLCDIYPNNNKTIVSRDRDYLQLIDIYTNVYEPKLDTTYDYKWLLNKHNITDINLARKLEIITKILVGDSSDNISGLKNIGKSKAEDILNKYKTNTLSDDDKLFLNNNRDIIELYKKLIQLDLLPQNYKDKIYKAIFNIENKLMPYIVNDDNVLSEIIQEFKLKTIQKMINKFRDWI